MRKLSRIKSRDVRRHYSVYHAAKGAAPVFNWPAQMVFERILVPLDGSPIAERALRHAARLACTFGSRVLLLRVLDTQSAIFESHPDCAAWRLHRLEARRYISRIARDAASLGIEPDWYLAEGRPAEQIHRFIQAHDVDLVILNAYGEGEAFEFPFGGTAHKIALTPGISCIVLRSDEREDVDTPHYRKILVPLDGSKRAEWAIKVAAGMAADTPAEVILLQVVVLPEMLGRKALTREDTALHERLADRNRSAAETYLREMRREHAANQPVRTRIETSANVARTILDVAAEEDVDLIILAAHPPDETSVRIHKAVCQSVLANSHRPVLILQRKGSGPSRGTTGRQVNILERKLVET